MSKLNEATQTLFHIAARSHVLAEQFGIELNDDETITLKAIPRPWLVPSFFGGDELTFDPDKYAKTLDSCSTYTRHMSLWILNVWNPGAAKSKGWTFDLFAAMQGLDSGNLSAIAWHLQHPVMP